jgi:transposase
MRGMKPYSEDLRRSIVRAVEDGMPKSAAARFFGVSLSSVKRYARITQRGGSLAPRKGGGRPPRRPTRPRADSSKVTSRSVQPLPWHKGVVASWSAPRARS